MQHFHKYMSYVRTPLFALKHFGWKYIIVRGPTDGGQPDRPAATGGSDIVVLQKLHANGATKIDSFLDLTFITLLFPPPPARPIAPQNL